MSPGRWVPWALALQQPPPLRSPRPGLRPGRVLLSQGGSEGARGHLLGGFSGLSTGSGPRGSANAAPGDGCAERGAAEAPSPARCHGTDRPGRGRGAGAPLSPCSLWVPVPGVVCSSPLRCGHPAFPPPSRGNASAVPQPKPRASLGRVCHPARHRARGRGTNEHIQQAERLQPLIESVHNWELMGVRHAPRTNRDLPFRNPRLRKPAEEERPRCPVPCRGAAQGHACPLQAPDRERDWECWGTTGWP